MLTLRLALIGTLFLASCDAPTSNDQKEIKSQSASALAFRTIAGEDVFAVIVPARTSADELVLSARKQCGQREFCQVHGWMSEADAATAIPMTDREVATQVFEYAHNRSTGFEKRLWDCARWPRKDEDECLAKD
jgi:hypothetical protein